MSQKDLSVPSSSPWSELDQLQQSIARWQIDLLGEPHYGEAFTLFAAVVAAVDRARLQVAQEIELKRETWLAERRSMLTQIFTKAADVDALRGQLATAHHELTCAHSDLDGTRASVTKGKPLAERVEWFKTLLVRERDAEVEKYAAVCADIDAIQAQEVASEHRRLEAENRAEAFELRAEAAEAALSTAHQEIERLADVWTAEALTHNESGPTAARRCAAELRAALSHLKGATTPHD